MYDVVPEKYQLIVYGLWGVGVAAISGRLLWRGLRRFPTADDIPQSFFRNRAKIRGRVVSVPDGDGFRIYHTPFLRTSRPPDKIKLSEETVYVRLAGIDAPEMAFFGQEGQPYAIESRDYLRGLAMERVVTVQLLQRDQYRRAVCMAWVRPPFSLFKRNISLDMVQKGLAIVYTSANAQYGDILERLERAQEVAKKSKVGMWKQGRKFVSPRDYKKLGLKETNPEDIKAAKAAATRVPLWKRLLTGTL